MKIILEDAARVRNLEACNQWRKLFTSGKLRIDWSQTRGCVAIFVSGRMEGPGFDSHEQAEKYLLDLGIDV